MARQLCVIVYPVTDVAKAKAVFSELLGVQPYADSPYYVGFRPGDIEVGLVPNGREKGMTGPVAYWNADDIEANVQALLDAGARLGQPVTDVGGGLRTASVRDADENTLGLRQ